MDLYFYVFVKMKMPINIDKSERSIAIMNVETVKIESISPDPANVRTHSQRNLDAIKASLARFGQVTPIVVDSHNVIRKGNGTFAAAKALGWQEIKIVRTTLAGSEATAYAIADNRTGDPEVGSLWDAKALAETLSALKAEGDDIATVTGFTAAEIASLLAGAATDLIPAEAAGTEYDESAADDVETIVCPHCGKEFPR